MCLEPYISVLLNSIHLTWQFLNSNFFTSVAGAFAGAYGGYLIVAKANSKELLLKEIRNTNAAIMVAFEITNTYLSFKKQYVKSLWDGWVESKNNLDKFAEGRRLGNIPATSVFSFPANLQGLVPPLVPSEQLLKLIFDEISLNGRPLVLTTTLVRAIDGVNATLRRRNEVIAEHGATFAGNNEKLIQLYFGLPDKEGHINTVYPDSVKGIHSQTDDCIYFSHLLIADLVIHGEKLRQKFGKKAPIINKPHFEKAFEEGLMPEEKDYKDWSAMFPKPAA